MRVLRAISVLVVVVAVAVLIWRAAIRAPKPGNAPGVSPRSAATTWTPITEQTLSHGGFNKLTVYSPHSTPRGFVLLLSGAEGWTEVMSAMATRIAEQGAMVVGIDAPQLDASLEEDGATCVF